MKREYRKKNKKDVIILRGTKYLLIITAVLFVAVFLLTRLTQPAKTKEPDATVITPQSESTQATEPEVKVNIDNEWAMFLVNNQNPLPDNYDSIIQTELVYTSYREYYMDARMADYMKRMLADAEKDGINLKIMSAYRTIEYQQQNFENSVQDRIAKGMTEEEAREDTAREVAFPGKSEHNAGLSADIMSDEYESMDDDGFKDTKAYAWLSEHAAEYGFILRYPENKEHITNIIYEPWHYRFVGVYYANEIKESGLCLEEYFEKQGWLDKNGKTVEMTGPVEKEEPVTTAPPSEPAQTQSEQEAQIIV